MREGSATLVALGALVVSVLAVIVVAVRPPVVVYVPGDTPGSPEQANVVAIGGYPECSWNGTSSDITLRFGYENRGNRTARNAVANLTYTAEFGNTTTYSLYLELAFGDIPAHTSGYVEQYSVWEVWGVNRCTRQYDFRITFTWER